MSNNIKTTALEIKYALMYYFRFKRQWICASECMNNDVMAITNKDVIDVEVKISKYDLWKGEAKKSKHKLYSNSENPYWKYHRKLMANRFYICVPLNLEKEAKKWVEKTNPKYGIIRYYPDCHVTTSISITKTARTLKKEVFQGLEKDIMMRVCSENIGLIEKQLIKDE